MWSTSFSGSLLFNLRYCKVSANNQKILEKERKPHWEQTGYQPDLRVCQERRLLVEMEHISKDATFACSVTMVKHTSLYSKDGFPRSNTM